MKKALMLAATLVSAAAVAAAAQPAATASEEKPGEEKMICRMVAELGSRLNRRRVCATKAQWDELNSQNRLAIDRVQNGRQSQGN
ncbi:MAG TPA: hypothetical protein VN231_04860 [Allosphingosinicella sp.]|nr:hypothetical protein [Allosphingosinicella sp.]